MLVVRDVLEDVEAEDGVELPDALVCLEWLLEHRHVRAVAKLLAQELSELGLDRRDLRAGIHGAFRERSDPGADVEYRSPEVRPRAGEEPVVVVTCARDLVQDRVEDVATTMDVHVRNPRHRRPPAAREPGRGRAAATPRPRREGRWLGERAGLAMRRLAIIDLETGDQPVANERGDVVAIVNGELYNYRELRAELEAKGHTFRGVGDVEVVPHLYEEHGERFVEHLRGMFAIALWDDST